MPLKELGINYIPQHSDFAIAHSNITLNGSGINMHSVIRWEFYLSSGVDHLPNVAKVTNTNGTSGIWASSFIINTGAGARYVSVFVGASDIGSGYGTFYTQLYAQVPSGKATHLQRYVTIQKTVRPTL